MTEDECARALDALRSAWQYTPMQEVQARQFKRLFFGYPVEIVRAVLDDLIRRGVSRPGPAEMGELLRTRMGAKVERRPEYLDDIPIEDCPAPEEIPDRVAELRSRIKAES